MTSRQLARIATPNGTTVVRVTPPLTNADRAAIAKHGRKGLLKRLRLRMALGWSIVLGGFTVAFPLMMSDSESTSDLGLIFMLLTIPGVLIGGISQTRIQRIEGNDPKLRRIVAPPSGQSPAPESDELQHLDLLRDRLLATLPALEEKYADVAEEIRKADQEACDLLRQQGEALATLEQIPLNGTPATQAAKAEIRARMRKGVEEYHQLLAESVLLIARTDGHVHVDAPLARARDIVLTYSEGLRVSEGLDDDAR